MHSFFYSRSGGYYTVVTLFSVVQNMRCLLADEPPNGLRPRHPHPSASPHTLHPAQYVSPHATINVSGTRILASTHFYARIWILNIIFLSFSASIYNLYHLAIIVCLQPHLQTLFLHWSLIIYIISYISFRLYASICTLYFRARIPTRHCFPVNTFYDAFFFSSVLHIYGHPV